MMERLFGYGQRRNMINTYEKNQMLTLLYRIFQAEEYRWFHKDGEEGVPTLEKIEEVVEGLEQSAWDVKGFAESGRIRVHYDKETKSFEYYLNLGGN
jgi:hypothetical protein